MKFPFELLSDADETACKLFGVIKMKTCTEHVQEVLNFVKAP
jgi:peroxiredoxin